MKELYEVPSLLNRQMGNDELDDLYLETTSTVNCICELCHEQWCTDGITICNECDAWIEQVENEQVVQPTSVVVQQPSLASDLITNLNSRGEPGIASTLSPRMRGCVRCRKIGSQISIEGYCERCYEIWIRDRKEAIAWARTQLHSWHERRDWVILDTETTGLHSTAEIVEIGVLAPDGTVLLDSLIRPMGRIPAGATNIHKISNQMVAEAPTFGELYPRLAQHLCGRSIVVYNAQYDRRRLMFELRRLGLRPFDCRSWSCAMQWYAKFVGDWNQNYGNYRWHKLQGGDHSAIGDCRATLALINHMAKS